MIFPNMFSPLCCNFACSFTLPILPHPFASENVNAFSIRPKTKTGYWAGFSPDRVKVFPNVFMIIDATMQLTVESATHS
jgi:hypothetical protein